MSIFVNQFIFCASCAEFRQAYGAGGVQLYQQLQHIQICPALLKAPFVCNACPQNRYASCKYVRDVCNAASAQKEYESPLKESRAESFRAW